MEVAFSPEAWALSPTAIVELAEAFAILPTASAAFAVALALAPIAAESCPVAFAPTPSSKSEYCLPSLLVLIGRESIAAPPIANED